MGLGCRQAARLGGCSEAEEGQMEERLSWPWQREQEEPQDTMGRSKNGASGPEGSRLWLWEGEAEVPAATQAESPQLESSVRAREARVVLFGRSIS